MSYDKLVSCSFDGAAKLNGYTHVLKLPYFPAYYPRQRIIRIGFNQVAGEKSFRIIRGLYGS